MHPRQLIIAGASVLVLAAFPAASALAGNDARPAHSAAAKPFTAQVRYTETNHGQQQGQATTGIVGHGSFSGKVGAHAALAAFLVSLATGIPVNQVARGGTYAVRKDVSGSGLGTGLVVAKFKARGLGALCLSFRFVPGKYVPGASFVPVGGTFRTAGGTGAAARWHGGLQFKQTSVTGSSSENIGVSGQLAPSTGAAVRMSRACQAVARLA